MKIHKLKQKHLGVPLRLKMGDIHKNTNDDRIKEIKKLRSNYKNSPQGLPNSCLANNCFINSTVQLIFNNDHIINLMLTHNNLELREIFQDVCYELYSGLKLSPYNDLVLIIRKFANMVGSTQDSPAGLIGKLIESSSEITIYAATSFDQINEMIECHKVFEKLMKVESETALLNTINNFPIKTITNSNSQEITISDVYDKLKEFVFHDENKIFAEYNDLFNKKSFSEFKGSLSNDGNLKRLHDLIKSENFKTKYSNTYSLIDTSGYNFERNSYYIFNEYSVKNPLLYNQIPEPDNLNTILVHKSNKIRLKWLHEGHYVAYIKHDNTWYLCDDECVTKVNDMNASIGKNNIVLFCYSKDNQIR